MRHCTEERNRLVKLRSFLLTLLLALPLRSEPRKVVVRGTDHTCPAQLSDGTTYEIHYRTLRTRWHDRDVHVVVKAYYKPGSGEFLYYSSIWSEEDYSRTVKQHEAWSCKPNDGSVVLLAGGQWADFMALTSGPRLEVFHSRLRFSSIEEAWRHVSTHFDECQTLAAKCYDEIPLYKDLDFDFFRPESFRQNAAPYDYNRKTLGHKPDEPEAEDGQ